MPIKIGACSAFAAALFGLALTTMPAHAYVDTGMMSCRSPGTASYIVFSARTFECVFTPSSGAPPQYYQATVQRLGAQIGFTNDVALGWAVFAATSRVGPGALAGGYVGASGGAAVGVGVAANGLVGVAYAKESVRSGLDMTEADGIDHEALFFAALFATADQREGMRAFLDKRKPEFFGK